MDDPRHGKPVGNPIQIEISFIQRHFDGAGLISLVLGGAVPGAGRNYAQMGDNAADGAYRAGTVRPFGIRFGFSSPLPGSVVASTFHPAAFLVCTFSVIFRKLR